MGQLRSENPYDLPPLGRGVYVERVEWASSSLAEYEVRNEHGYLLMEVRVVAELDEPELGKRLRRWLQRKNPERILWLFKPSASAARATLPATSVGDPSVG